MRIFIFELYGMYNIFVNRSFVQLPITQVKVKGQ